jgi:hypothetical protein
MLVPVRVSNRDLKPHKAALQPVVDARTVLTNSPWDFVALWLKREEKDDALLYWNQARSFADAGRGMPIQSAPLLHYYSFMNAAKALLSAKGIAFDEYHGVKAHNIRGASLRITLSNEGVRLLAQGVAPSLSAYLQEPEPSRTHSLEELLLNIPCIHRTFCLTYRSQPDLFIPLTDCRYLYDTDTGMAHVAATLSKDFGERRFIRRLPASLQHVNGLATRSVLSVPLSGQVVTDPADVDQLMVLHRAIRQDLHYINGAQTLWYAKSNLSGRLQRFPLTLALMAMHRLSEICRYRPVQLAAFLSGQKNWLLSEFIQMAPQQFLDEVAAELTGYQFMIPNVRPAS